jgi:hypothetical protein
MKRNIIFISCFAIALPLFYYFYSKPKVINSAIQVISPLHKEILSKLHSDWQQGVDLKDENFTKNCIGLNLNMSKVADELRGCRRALFRCFYENRTLKIKNGKGYVPYQIIFNNTKSKTRWSFPITIKTKNKKYQAYLQNSCHREMLPRYYYNHGRLIRADNTWHPGDTKYWLDKYQVRNIDIWDWIQEQAVTNVKANMLMPFSAAVNLTKEQMKQYCRYQGGVVMSSRVADAVTYYSTSNMKSGNISKTLSPYPFTPRRTEGPHAKALKDKSYQLTKKDCAMIETKECLEQGWPAKISQTLGWSGIGELLGGPLEYVHNSSYKRYNLILSSYYFNLNTLVHRAGERGFWDGEGFKARHFKFPMVDTITDVNFKVAFRCMGVKHD